MRTSSSRRRLAGAVAVLASAAGLGACAGHGDHATGSSAGTGGDATDKAFVRQMIPHHEGAVDMARTALARAEHRELKGTLAPAIIRAQEVELAQLRAKAEELGVEPGAGHGAGHGDGEGDADPAMEADAKTLGLALDEMGMDMDPTALEAAEPFDRAFLGLMVEHHEGAVRMARAQLTAGDDAELKTLARTIVADQTREIAQMKGWRDRWYGAP